MSYVPPAPHVRRAWLTMGAQLIDCEYPPGGWFCEDLDLGWPTVRAVVANRPDADGTIDRTAYFADRPVTIAIHAAAGAGARLDAVAAAFAPFMAATARPVLHFVLDRPGAAERTITLRPAGFSWPIQGAAERSIQLQFTAPDPSVYDPVQQSSTAWSGVGAAGGRTYPLAFNRTYPAGTTVGNIAVIHGHGDLPIKPLLRIYGPVTAPLVTISPPSGSAYVVGFVSTAAIAAGAWVDVDCDRKTAYLNSDPTQNWIAQLDWAHIAWPVLPVGVDNLMTLGGSSASGTTQVDALWNDRYLT